MNCWWISKMQSGRKDTLEEQYEIKFWFKLIKKKPEKRMECFKLLLNHFAWIKHRFLSGISDSRKQNPVDKKSNRSISGSSKTLRFLTYWFEWSFYHWILWNWKIHHHHHYHREMMTAQIPQILCCHQSLWALFLVEWSRKHPMSRNSE